MRKLFYWLAKIGNAIVVVAWFLIGLVVFIPLSSLFLKPITFKRDEVTGKTDLTWRKFISVVRTDRLLGRILGMFIKLGVYAIGDLVGNDIMDECLYIPTF